MGKSSQVGAMEAKCELVLSSPRSEAASRTRQEEEDLCKPRVGTVGLEVDSSRVAEVKHE